MVSGKAPGATLTRGEATSVLKDFVQTIVESGPPTDAEWELAFQDEFDGESLNWDVWESQNGPSGHILSSRWPENAEVRDGTLRLITRKEQKGGQDWTSASVWVKRDVFMQAFGYWECRYRYAAAPGLNNAWWMNAFYDNNDGPRAFEIDINEGHYPNYINSTLHYREVTDGEVKTISDSKRYVAKEYLSADFHVYGLEWTPEDLVYYLDGEEIERKPSRNAQLPVYPWVSTAVLAWGGPITDRLDGKSMDVDWVRVWKKKPAGE
ncbi:glycoside hydrolase family 16 protein [bacterium]|nr:glycoside hydrolase family 16 protein [bacterium]